MTEILLALLIPPALMVAWASVQFAWRRSMMARVADGDEPDALAVRGGGCGSCNCTNPCTTEQTKEEKR